MNFEERKNITFRIVSAVLLLITIAFSILSLIHVVKTIPEGMILIIIAITVTMAFATGEIYVILRGWKKESYLYKIVFNDNDSINNIPLIAVGVGTAFGVGLLALGISVYFVKQTEPTQSSMLVIITVASYLLLNCIIYYIYLIMFKKREINLRDFIK